MCEDAKSVASKVRDFEDYAVKVSSHALPLNLTSRSRDYTAFGEAGSCYDDNNNAHDATVTLSAHGLTVASKRDVLAHDVSATTHDVAASSSRNVATHDHRDDGPDAAPRDPLLDAIIASSAQLPVVPCGAADTVRGNNGDLSAAPPVTSHAASGASLPLTTEELEREALTAADLDADALTAEFRARIGLLSEEEEGLTDAFKAHLGLQGLDDVVDVGEISMSADWDRDATISNFTFARVAKTFAGGVDGRHSTAPLASPLLAKAFEIDTAASVVLWLAVQRWMGDQPTPDTIVRSSIPMMTSIYRTLETKSMRGRKVSTTPSNNNTNGPTEATKTEVESFKVRKQSSVKKFINKVTNKSQKDNEGSKKKKSLGESGYGNSWSIYEGGDPQTVLDQLPSHELDLLHFIVGHGILRKDLRDEILCQICKQLTQNPSHTSAQQGWILLAHCLGCFIPSNTFLPYMKCFLKDAAAEFKDTYVAYARKMLRRTLANGVRYHPPNFLELQGVRKQRAICVPVTLPTGDKETVETDAASTSSEVVMQIAARLGIQDTFGFSIYIAIFDKVSSLGSGYDHLNDAISECEQAARMDRLTEDAAPWQLFFRKELFSPWHDPVFDRTATDLIYTQFRKGLRCREYQIEADEQLAELTSKIYYVENGGGSIISAKVKAMLPAYISSKFVTSEHDYDWWAAMIVSYAEKHQLCTGVYSAEVDAQSIKEELISLAADKWTMQFSGLFEAFKIAGPALPHNDVIVGVNHKGVLVMHEPSSVALSLDLATMIEVSSSRSSKQRGQCFSISSITGEDYTFMSPNASNIANLLTNFLEGLRRRSPYAVAIQDYTCAEDALKRFGFRQGDLVTIVSTEADERTSRKKDGKEWVVVLHDESSTRGRCPLDSIYILPTLAKPGKSILGYFCKMNAKTKATLPRQKKSKLTLAKVGKHGAEMQV